MTYTYFDQDTLCRMIEKKEQFQNFIDVIVCEVHAFFKNFHDSPERVSAWGHHYFCKDDGAVLIYNENNPNSHSCSLCGKEFNNIEQLNGAWISMYRNQAAINLWKSALLFKLTNNEIYFNYIMECTAFYNRHYQQFKLHNKEGDQFESLANMAWGCGRIMPQALNEAIFLIRMIHALQLIRKHIPDNFMNDLKSGIFDKAFLLLRKQINKIHNIPCWLNSAIGIMGLFSSNNEMIDFAFNGEYNINRQLTEGVTADYFWYEGSIHYNFFLLEGIVHLLHFSRLYEHGFQTGLDYVKRMLVQAYKYAFNSHQFPNPNDGWPDVNLKSYSYIYSTAAKIYGSGSQIAHMLSSILNTDVPRGTFPLSSPYYFQNDISLEEFLFAPAVRDKKTRIKNDESVNFKSSYCGLVKSDDINIFFKYGHNGPSHAHPDKMNIEAVVKGNILTRDLSNSGYGNRFCNEWHRVSASHNTVVVNGSNHSGFQGGICTYFDHNAIAATAKNVYTGVTFERKVEIIKKGFTDHFSVYSDKENIYDYLFHVQGTVASPLKTKSAELGYQDNGYQYFSDVQQVLSGNEDCRITWLVGEIEITSIIDLKDKQLYIASTPDNPVNLCRKTILVRTRAANSHFAVIWLFK
ncbi:MAG: heparinase II/III-family protein [Spirochaetes bacterium]|nr:heparinase II/III-family protein [Spirochaetota bacterium]